MTHGERRMTRESKRIAVVGPVHPYRGGIAHFTEMTVDVLQAQGHDVRPVSFARQYPEVLFPGKTQFEPDSDAPASVAGAPRLLDPANPLAWWRTAQHLRRMQPDAVVFQYWMPFFAPAFGVVARLLRRAGVPSYSIVHNALPHERHLGDAWLSRFFFRACAGFVVLSDAVASDLRPLRRAGTPVAQIEHPVYTRFGEPVPQSEARAALDVPLPPGAPVLLFFGFIRKYKGLDVLLDAMPRIREQVPDLRLVIAGEAYDDAARYRNQIQTHGLSERVHWHARYIPSDAVPRYFGAADLVVQPYRSATQSGVAQVAFHFGVPMVLTDVGGLAEMVPHEQAGFVVPPADPDALADAVARYFVEDWKARLTAGVRQQKKRYAPERLAEALEQVMSA